MSDGPKPFEHTIPHKAVEPKVRRTLHLVELKSHSIPVNPSDLRFFDREGLFLIREDQPYAECGPTWRGADTLDRTAEHREVHHLPFCDRFRIGKHHRVLRRERNSIMVALVRVCGIHGSSV